MGDSNKPMLADRGFPYSWINGMIVVAVVSVLSVLGIVLWQLNRTQSQLIEDAALDSAKHYTEVVGALREIYTAEVVDRLAEQGILATHNYQQLEGAIPLPITLTTMLGEKINVNDSSAEVRLYSAYPFPWKTHESGLKTEFDKEAWAYLTEFPESTFYRIENYNGELALRYATADQMQANCVGCHNTYPGTPKNDWQVGDVRGVLEIIQPLEAISKRAESELAGVTALLVALTVGLAIAIATLLRWVFTQSAKFQLEVERRTSELNAALARTSAVMDTAIVGILTIDERGLIEDLNSTAETMFGYSSAELLGKNVSFLMPSPVAEEHDGYLLNYLATGQERIIGITREVVGRRKDGTLIELDLGVSKVVVEDRILFTGLVRDITKGKLEERARQKAESATHAKNEFIANMSHEIRTPMTAILGYSENLRDSELTESERLHAVDTIYENGTHLLAIINDILDLSKIEADRLLVEEIKCCPVQIMAEIVSLMEVRVKSRKNTLTCELDGPVPEFMLSDPIRLKQIIVNLVGNAVKFTENGHVRLVMRASNCDSSKVIGLELEVIDSGIGMTEAQVSRLFKPFTQADETLTRRYGGTGLGLSISQKLAELLGGGVSVQSRFGEGSTFFLRISAKPYKGTRLLSSMKAVEGVKEKKETGATPRIECRVLIAEDNLVNQHLISSILKKAGAEVTVADNGRIAVDIALATREKGRPHDVILMDMQMPILDGYGATRELRENGWEGPIIAVTANAMSDDQAQCIAAGCDAFITKPVDRKALITTIHNHLQLALNQAPNIGCSLQNRPMTGDFK